MSYSQFELVRYSKELNRATNEIRQASILDAVIEFERLAVHPGHIEEWRILRRTYNDAGWIIVEQTLVAADIKKMLKNSYFGSSEDILRTIGDHVHGISAPMTTRRNVWADTKTRAGYYYMLWAIRETELGWWN